MRGGNNQKVVNYVTGKANSSTRKNRVSTMLAKTPKNIKPSFFNRLMASKLMGSNTTPLPVGSMKKRGGQLTEYEMRALNELSHRSLNVAKSNIKSLKNKKNKKVLAKAYNKTRKNRG